jgi:predicted transcriptional regulator
MEEMPDKPWKELVIAIAGPLVNVVVAVILGFVFYGLYSQSFIATDLENFALTPENLQSFIRFMIVVNITLFLFNLIPAFPMDGGRILRALLSMVTTRVRATFIASVIGRILAVAFIALAVWLPHVTIGFIGVFIFFMATNENKQAVLKDKLSNTSLSEIMEKDYPLIFHHETMQKVLNFYNQGVARNFLVFDDNQNPIGSIPEVYIRDFIKRELSSDQLISKLMSSAFGYFTPEDRLEEVFETMNQNGWSIAGIKNGDRLVAVVDRHIINSFINRKA